MEFYFLLVSFFLIALLYASVGFGGGTSYLALMALMGVNFIIMKPAALLCNVVVVTGGTYIFYKEGHLDLKKSLPLVLTSVPLAFLGGYLKLEEATFFIILGLALMVASFLLWFQPQAVGQKQSGNLYLHVGLGGSLGFLSGLVGIGGGIFLAPILHFMNWDDTRSIAAVASFFILVNSISGLLGQWTGSVPFDFEFILPLLMVVFVGGQIGSWLGAKKLKATVIKKTTAVLILAAAINILKDYL
jgi:uncharacterized protein